MVKGKRMLLAYGKEMLHILRRFEQFQLGSSNNFILNGVLGVPVGWTNVFWHICCWKHQTGVAYVGVYMRKQMGL